MPETLQKTFLNNRGYEKVLYNISHLHTCAQLMCKRRIGSGENIAEQNEDRV